MTDKTNTDDSGRGKSGRFAPGNTHSKKPSTGNKNLCSMTKRKELNERFDASELTDPLDFLLQVVHNANDDGVAGKGIESTKDRIDCAKAAVPFIYAKPTIEIHSTSDTPELSLDGVTQRMLEILDLADNAIKESE